MTNLNPYTAAPAADSLSALPSPTSTAPKKLTSTAKEFESVLLTQWLQAAESSFGSVPGGDDDADSGGEQLKSFGIQQLATALSNAGGIGIARMVSKALSHAEAISDAPTHEKSLSSR